MKASETKALVAVLKSAYPRQPITPDTLALYAEMLADLDSVQSMAAVKRLIASHQFFPTVAEIRTEVTKGTVSLPGTDEAWNEVRRAIAREGCYRNPKFTHPAIDFAVETIGWQTLCASENIMAERAHFMRLYDETTKRVVTQHNLVSLPGARAPQKQIGGVVHELAVAKKLSTEQG